MRRTARLFRAAAVAALTAAGGAAVGQEPPPQESPPGVQRVGFGRPGAVLCPPVACPPAACPPGAAAPAAPGTPAPTDPSAPVPPVGPSPAIPPAGEAAPSFGGLLAGAGPGSTTAINPGGYIDGALPVSTVRVRFDAAYGNNRPDRAEYFYAKCGCFAALPPGNPLRDPKAKGPPNPQGETNVDYQELSTYLEGRVAERMSVFAEIPIRYINPTLNANASGISDVNFGFKYAFLLTDTRIATFQLRTYSPTGSPGQGLGTSIWSIEPGILWQEQPTDRLILFGEFKDRIPLGPPDDFAGNVLQYGLGASYIAYSSQQLRVMPVGELVGWTVLSGQELSDNGPVSARGDTIVNAKFGARLGFGQVEYPGALGRSDLYIGYGRALTGDVWYKDILRVEYRLRF